MKNSWELKVGMPQNALLAATYDPEQKSSAHDSVFGEPGIKFP